MDNKNSYSFPISSSACREMILASRENPKANRHSRYLVDFIKYFKERILEKETNLVQYHLRATS